jgi:Amt family ammonium transporter
VKWIKEGKPSLIGALTGAVAGLATITPCAGYVRPWAAAIIGVLSAAICYYAVQLRIKLEWDDALDVWGVHGVGGILGSILVGVFAESQVNGISGLIQGNIHQFGVQLLGVIISAVYSFIVTYLILKIINVKESVRVSKEVEAKGLDSAILGENAYDL